MDNAPDPAAPGFYGRLARYVIHHQPLTLGLLALATLIAGLFMTNLRIDSDILALMPPDDPSTAALIKLDQEEGGVNLLTLAVDGEDKTKRDAFMQELSARLEALPEVDYVLYQLEPKIALQIGALQLPREDLVTLRDRLGTALSMGASATNPFIAARLFDFGPLTERLASAGDGIKLSTGSVARIIVRPTGSAHDIPFARKFMADIDSILAGMKPEERGVQILWKGGAYRHNVEDYEGISQDLAWTTGASFFLVLLIIAGAFRAPRAVALIFIPLILSNIWTAGLAGATVGSINTFTSFTNAVLIGLGVEFGVHLYARFREQRATGLSTEDAVVQAWDLVGSACTSAALTSSAGFAALFAAHFRGFQQLGWLLSAGLMLTLLAELLLMPILLTRLEPRAAHPHAHKVPPKRRKLPMLYRLAPVTLIVLAVLTAVAGTMVQKIGFEYDLSELRRAGLAYEDLTEQERALARDSYSPLLVDYPDAAALHADHIRLSQKLADKRLPEVSRLLSIHTVLPDDQAERVALIQEITAALDHPNAQYLPASIRGNLTRLRDAGIRVLAPADLPEALQHILGAAHGKHRLMIVPGGNMWDMREAAKLVDTVQREIPDHVVAGEYMTLGRLYQMMLRDAPIIAVIAALLVCLFTWSDLRGFWSTAGALLVQIAGIAWWAGLLVISDIRISIVNFVGIPIVMGIGIDVMIHMIHRLKQEGPGKITRVLATTGWASALGTSTTVVAFAALSLASSQGVRSLGMLVLLGETAVTVAGFVLIPLGFASVWHLQRRVKREE